MVEFGKTLERAKRPEWASNYLDYERLKSILKRIDGGPATASHRRSYSQSFLVSTRESFSSTTGSTPQQDMHPECQTLWLEFRRVLDQEIETVVLFSLHEQGRIAEQISRLMHPKQQCLEQVANLWQHHMEANPDYGDQISRQIRDIYRKYQSIAHQVLNYVAFCELNVTAVRKILKKHDKLHPRQTLTETYVHKFVEQATDSHLHQLYNHGGLSAIVASLARAFDQLQQAEALVLAMTQGILPGAQNSPRFQGRRQRVRSMPLLLSDFESGLPNNNYMAQQQVSVLGSSAIIPADRRPFADDDCPTNPASPPVTARLSSTSTYQEPLLDQIHAARSRLKQSTKYVELIATRALIFEDEDDIGQHAAPDTDDDARRRKRMSSLLNLASTFFYLTNYYIVAPTTGQYAVEVGSSEAMAGIILGMTPNAALIATVLYGWWSNYAYKSALLFAAGSSLLGNLCYALALRHHSIHMIILGRFLNGFGSARSINRRYIADTFSRGERTAESAAFVTAGAMGMAAGPAIAALLGVWFRVFPSRYVTHTPHVRTPQCEQDC
jgi:hypothetical protein